MRSIGLTEITLILATLLIPLIPIWRIVKRIGFTPWISILMVIPLVNIIVLYVVAIVPWPIDRRQ